MQVLVSLIEYQVHSSSKDEAEKKRLVCLFVFLLNNFVSSSDKTFDGYFLHGQNQNQKTCSNFSINSREIIDIFPASQGKNLKCWRFLTDEARYLKLHYDNLSVGLYVYTSFSE